MVMIKRLCLVFTFIACSLPISLFAAGKDVAIIILPFEINAAENLAYLKTEIPKVIGQNLIAEGAKVVQPQEDPSVSGAPITDPAFARRLGVENGVNYVLVGSLTLIGQQFSLDTRLVESFNTSPPQIFSVSGRGLENLPLKVRELAREIIVIIFEQKKIIDIRIEGSQRIEADAIRRLIKSNVGDIYSVKNLSDDLKSIYGMGYFDDVRIEAEDEPAGKKIIIHVKEKPTIRYVRFKGNYKFDDKEMKENITLKTGSILNVFHVQNNLQRIEELYKDKNYHNVEVNYEIEEVSNNQADVTFDIKEGNKVRIEKIYFEGNQAFSDKKLKKQISTSEKSWLSIFTNSGDLNMDDLNQDAGRLEAFYQNQGYIRVKVGEPQVEFKEEGIDVTIKIEEGPRYTVGAVGVDGELIFPSEVLLEKTKLKDEEFYNRTILRNDLITLSDLYADAGYAYADIAPRIDENSEELVVNIIYQIQKGPLVYFEEITIDGNSTTRDKVIRRQLEVHEQGLYSGSRLKRSVRNINRLDFFEDVKIDTVKGSADDKMLLTIDVKEKSTGQFSIGGGYSNVEKLFFTGSIAQRNLFGRGQILNLTGQIGSLNRRYRLSFTEPWLFDIPLAGTLSVYNWLSTFDSYERDSLGGSAFLGYPVYRNTRLRLGVNYDSADINIKDAETAPVSILELVEAVGRKDIITLSTEVSLAYDTRDRIFSTTKGSLHRLSAEYAGFGGDIGFNKYIGQVGWYYPLVERFIGHMRARGGYVGENSSGFLPDYELFYMQGIESLIGYDRDEIQPRDARGEVIGGDRFAYAMVQLLRPLLTEFGLDGFLFYNVGAIASSEPGAEPQNINGDSLRHSVGVGVNWNSPMGPIALAYGFKIGRKEGESAGAFDFNFGGAF